ncbi:MAG: DUF2752 domain-containing protein [Verrucomicrobiales bacterium]|nr:DUF2752 domain-containing protein [Verrucomicrobiales bacterium]
MRAESKIIPPKIPAPLSPGVFAGVVLGATAIGVGATIFFFNPGTHAFYPVCIFHSLTGLNCPGCGMTRALHGLLHGNLMLALKDNALFVASLAAAAAWSVRIAVRKMRNQPVNLKIPAKFLWLLLVLAILFGVFRNLPGFEWLSP